MTLKIIIKKCIEFLFRLGVVSDGVLHESFSPFSQSKKLSKLKDKFAGKRCFIIGNGPSLNKIDLSLLKNEYSFGVNSIFLKTDEEGFTPTFYVVEDSHVLEDNLARIKSYKARYKFFPANYLLKLGFARNNYFFNMNRSFYSNLSSNYESPMFSTDASQRVYCGQSVTIINLQLAFYLGFTEVYLIGMDFDYKIPVDALLDGSTITSTSDDPNHFSPDYFGKGKKWHDPKLRNVLVSYKNCKIIYEHFGRSIFNATKGGKLEVFDRVDYESLFI